MNLLPSNREILVFGRQRVIIGSSERMEEIPDNSIDVIVTSPPYNVGKKYTPDGSFTDKLPMDEYLLFLKNVFRECLRVLKPDGLFFLNIGDSAKDQGKSEKVVNTAVHAGFKRVQTIIWVKSIFGMGHYTPSGGKRRFNNVWENVFLLSKTKNYRLDPKRIGIPYTDKSNIGRYSKEDLRDPGDVWFVPYEVTTGAKIKKGHEAPFPIGLPYLCIKSVPDAKTVLDPFAGTGSTLAASEYLGLEGIGYELFPKKEVIRKRILENSFKPPNTPLPRQLEKYVSIVDEILYNALQFLSEEQKRRIMSKLSKKKKKTLTTSMKDLKHFPEWLEKMSQLLEDYY